MNMKKFFAFLMMLCLLMALVPAQAYEAEPCGITYWVGETQYYGENNYFDFSHIYLAYPGDPVTVTPKEGIQITHMVYYLSDNEEFIGECQQDGNQWSFTMPESGVDVYITFVGAPSGGNSNPPPIVQSVMVTFDPQGGSCTSSGAGADSDGKLSDLPTPTKDGYIFVGWFLDSGEKVTLDTVFSETTTVKAHWVSSSDVSAYHITDPETNIYFADIDLDDSTVFERLLAGDDHLTTGEDIYVWMEVNRKDEDELPHDEMNAISVKAGDDKIAAYLDISLYKKIGENGEKTKIPNTNGPIPITMNLMDDVIPENATADSFYIISYHNGDVYDLAASYTPSKKTLTFSAEKFSTYALVHKTHTPSQNIPAPQTSAPKTGDSSRILLWSALACVSLIGVSVLVRKKKEA